MKISAPTAARLNYLTQDEAMANQEYGWIAQVYNATRGQRYSKILPAQAEIIANAFQGMSNDEARHCRNIITMYNTEVNTTKLQREAENLKVMRFPLTKKKIAEFIIDEHKAHKEYHRIAMYYHQINQHGLEAMWEGMSMDEARHAETISKLFTNPKASKKNKSPGSKKLKCWVTGKPMTIKQALAMDRKFSLITDEETHETVDHYLDQMAEKLHNPRAPPFIHDNKDGDPVLNIYHEAFSEALSKATGNESWGGRKGHYTITDPRYYEAIKKAEKQHERVEHIKHPNRRQLGMLGEWVQVSHEPDVWEKQGARGNLYRALIMKNGPAYEIEKHLFYPKEKRSSIIYSNVAPSYGKALLMLTQNVENDSK